MLIAAALIGTVSAVVGPGAEAAKPGVADKFTGTEMAEARLAATGAQRFTFGPFTVACEQAKSVKSGAAQSWPSVSLFAELRFSGCSAVAKLPRLGELELKAKFLAPVDLNFNANGFVEAGAGGKPANGGLDGAGPIEIALSGPVKCTIDVEAGTFPGQAIKRPGAAYDAALYKPEVKLGEAGRAGAKDELGITTALSRMAYELEGEFCEAFPKTEGRAGSYSGSLLAELPKGGLGWAATTPLGQTAESPLPSKDAGAAAIAVGPEGNIWFTEDETSRIGVINPFTHASSDFPTATPKANPAGIALGPEGDLWYAEYGVDRIGVIDPVTHATHDFPIPTPESTPYYITAGPEGDLWFTEILGGKVGVIDPVTGAISEFPTPSAGPVGITTGAEGDIWFAEGDAVSEIDPVTHATSTFAGLPGESGPFAITGGPEGNIWFTSVGVIGEINPLTGVVTGYPAPTGTYAPDGIAVGPEGNIWYTEYQANRIGELNPTTHTTHSFRTIASLSVPRGITAGADGNMWFDESFANSIGVIGTGAPPASGDPPVLLGGGHAGAPQSCVAGLWSDFASQPPASGLFAFDGYRWLLDGGTIPGQDAASYTPSVAEEGHALACSQTVSYPLTHVTAVAASAPVTVVP